MRWIEDGRITEWFARSDAGGDRNELRATLDRPQVRVARVGAHFDVVVTPRDAAAQACELVVRKGGRLGAIVESCRGNWSVLVPAGTARAWVDLVGGACAAATCSPTAMYVWLPAAPPVVGAPVKWAVPPRPDKDGAPILTDPASLAAALLRVGGIRAHSLR
ncbi:hypothetical protein ACU686_12880 [Yinghuangia aomiensis]